MIQTHAEHPSLLDLPTEILDSILDHLSDHRSSLESCCFVSRVFLPTARAHLFRRVVLYACPQNERPHLRAGTKLRRLVELPHLLSHTREFQISINWHNIDAELLPALEAFITLKNDHITTHCGHSLQCISLERINWDMSSPNPLNAALQRLLALESVTHIRICWGNIPLNIFQHFPSGIKTLELVHTTFQNSGAPAQVPVNLPAIRLESLIITQMPNLDKLARAIFNNPNRECDGTSIRTLHMIAFKAREFGTYLTFAPHVEKLALLRVSGDYTPLDFSQLSRLRCLEVWRHAMFPIDVDRVTRWLVQSLRNLKPGNSFRSITLIYYPDEVYDVLAWAELDSVLTGSRFESESFRGITIKVSQKLQSTDFYPFLPKTIDKKLLKVVYTY